MSLTLGGNITLQGSISHTVLALTPIDTINYTAAKWGYIEGTLSDQTDLMALLNLKANSADLASVATSGSYNDLTNLPTIPTKVSDLTNDSGFLTENDVAPVATSGDYSDLSNLPTIPTSTSELTNDSNFVADPSYVHTDSNFTLGEKGKLASIESGAEENVIEVIKVNGVTQTVTNKEVDLIVSGGGNVDDVEVNGVSVVTNKIAEVTVPTKTSDLTNDSGFITSVPTEVFWATYGTTTFAELDAEYQAGKLLCCKYDGDVYTFGRRVVQNSYVSYTLTTYDNASNTMKCVQLANMGTWGHTSVALVSQNGLCDVYWCDYGSTTSAEIESALDYGKIPCVYYNDYVYTLRFRNSSTNHRFVCNYGGKEKSVACQSGTWIPNADLTFLTSAPVSSVNGQTGAVVISTATTSADGLMSSTDKTKLEAVYADYSSALTALGA